MKRNKLKLKTFLFIEVTFNISGHTIMTFTKKIIFWPLTHFPSAKMNNASVNSQTGAEFQDSTPSLTPNLPYGRQKCMAPYRNGFKKRKSLDRLQTSKVKFFMSFCNTLFWFVWQSQIYVTRIKNKICYMIEVMSCKYLLFSQ